MLEKIASLPTLRNFSVLSRSFLKQGNLSLLRCYSFKPNVQVIPNKLNKLSVGPVTFRNALSPNATQLTKITGNLLIQKRWSSHDHVNLWKFERIVSALFIPVLPLCLLLDNPVLDSFLAILSVLHVHWGMEAIIVDYARPIVVGPIVPKVCFIVLYLTSALTLAGLLVLAYNGPGISKVIKQGWAIGNKDK